MGGGKPEKSSSEKEAEKATKQLIQQQQAELLKQQEFLEQQRLELQQQYEGYSTDLQERLRSQVEAQQRLLDQQIMSSSKAMEQYQQRFDLLKTTLDEQSKERESLFDLINQGINTGSVDTGQQQNAMQGLLSQIDDSFQQSINQGNAMNKSLGQETQGLTAREQRGINDLTRQQGEAINQLAQRQQESNSLMSKRGFAGRTEGILPLETGESQARGLSLLGQQQQEQKPPNTPEQNPEEPLAEETETVRNRLKRNRKRRTPIWASTSRPSGLLSMR